MIKEMRPSHRIDVLTDALLYYTQQSLENLASRLVNRMNRAIQVQAKAKETLEGLMKNSPISFTTSDVEEWYSHELSQCTAARESSGTDEWESQYCSLLENYYSLREGVHTFCGSNTNHTDPLLQRYYKLNEKLCQIETRHKITQRWDETSQVYIEQKMAQASKRKVELLKNMSTCLRERWFLLSVKAKFADGHNMAARVSKSITAASVQLKKYLSDYNKIPQTEPLSWQDVTNLSSPLWLFDSFNGISQNIPKSIKLASITNHHLILRADEEIKILKHDMSCVIRYNHNHLQKLYGLIEGRGTSSLYEAGAKCLILYKIMEVEQRLISCSNKFSSFVTDGTCTINIENFMTHKIGELIYSMWDHDATTDSWQCSELLENPLTTADDLTDTFDTDDESYDCFEEDADNFSIDDDYSIGVNDDDISTISGSDLLPREQHVSCSSLQSGSNLLPGEQLISHSSCHSGSNLLPGEQHVICSSHQVSGRDLLPGEQNISSSSHKGESSQLPGKQHICNSSHQSGSNLLPGEQQVSHSSLQTPLSTENSSESEEEMEVQDWRVKYYLQEEYLKAIRSTNADDLMDEFRDDMKILQRVTQAPPASLSRKPKSFLTYPQSVLKELIKR